ncbi:MAG: 4-hydroxythreonine-4-phosphate dehydrogenase PdxA [Gammaproteobacteria bacterium]|nr:4-hydroxythreonine-4-phosphate dehydrogenase PdxA [Gammaproteobacteria bacterium]MDE0443454.1 4-hydroxythreonine-4-phosphate dehydrogenase PdxA [Gammaproteobacteria bacterium]
MTRIGITLGDPAGIGPEVAVKALNAKDVPAAEYVLYGPAWALQLGADHAGLTLPVDCELVDIDVPRASDFQIGKVSAGCGEASVAAVERCARDAIAGDLAAMMTCPLHKEAIHAAGYVDDIGHQEILARLTRATTTATMLMTPGLRVVHLSTHKSLIEAGRFVTRANVLDKLRLCHDSLTAWGLGDPRIAVAALNPHGGEGGLLGREEIDEIAPAVEAARELNIDAIGPLPADSVFNRAIAGEFDVALAMYHDQGHIAIKVHNFHESVTATLGIPLIRTSVDHGTAFDIAGLGIADATGAIAALRAAVALAEGTFGR